MSHYVTVNHKRLRKEMFSVVFLTSWSRTVFAEQGVESSMQTDGPANEKALSPNSSFFRVSGSTLVTIIFVSRRPRRVLHGDAMSRSDCTEENCYVP